MSDLTLETFRCQDRVKAVQIQGNEDEGFLPSNEATWAVGATTSKGTESIVKSELLLAKAIRITLVGVRTKHISVEMKLAKRTHDLETWLQYLATNTD